MSEVKVNIWGLCPFRSPVETPEGGSVVSIAPPSAPRQSLGPCLYLGCGMWKVTKFENGQPTDGMCSLRYTAECLGEVAGALQKIATSLMATGEVPTGPRSLS